jgi:hypothetical protein
MEARFSGLAFGIIKTIVLLSETSPAFMRCRALVLTVVLVSPREQRFHGRPVGTIIEEHAQREVREGCFSIQKGRQVLHASNSAQRPEWPLR